MFVTREQRPLRHRPHPRLVLGADNEDLDQWHRRSRPCASRQTVSLSSGAGLGHLHAPPAAETQVAGGADSAVAASNPEERKGEEA